MTRTILHILLLVLAAALFGRGHVTGADLVPGEDVAIGIAVAAWGPIYGEERIAEEGPYRATLSEGVWTVEGSLPDESDGGAAVARISKKDGRILRVIHEQ